jgi:hypothetical protein
MFASTRLQLLFSAYGVLLAVSMYEFIRDLFVTHNLLISTLHSYVNPINWCMFPFALIIGFLLAKELEA